MADHSEAPKLSRAEARSKRTRAQATVPTLPFFDDACVELKLDARGLCNALGYAPHSYHDWINSGQLPLKTARAMQAMLTAERHAKVIQELKAQSKMTKPTGWVVIKTMTPEQRTTIKTLAIALGLGDHLIELD